MSVGADMGASLGMRRANTNRRVGPSAGRRREQQWGAAPASSDMPAKEHRFNAETRPSPSHGRGRRRPGLRVGPAVGATLVASASCASALPRGAFDSRGAFHRLSPGSRAKPPWPAFHLRQPVRSPRRRCQTPMAVPEDGFQNGASSAFFTTRFLPGSNFAAVTRGLASSRSDEYGRARFFAGAFLAVAFFAGFFAGAFFVAALLAGAFFAAAFFGAASFLVAFFAAFFAPKPRRAGLPVSSSSLVTSSSVS